MAGPARKYAAIGAIAAAAVVAALVLAFAPQNIPREALSLYDN